MHPVRSRRPTASPPSRAQSFERDAAALHEMLRRMDEHFQIDDAALNAERQLRLQRMEEEQITLQRLCEAAVLAQSGRSHDGIVSSPRSMASSELDNPAEVARRVQRSVSQIHKWRNSGPSAETFHAAERPRRTLRPPAPPTDATFSPQWSEKIEKSEKGEKSEKSEAEDRRLLESFFAAREEVPHPYAPNSSHCLELSEHSARREQSEKVTKALNGESERSRRSGSGGGRKKRIGRTLQRPLLRSASGNTISRQGTVSLSLTAAAAAAAPMTLICDPLIQRGASQDHFDVHEDEELLRRFLCRRANSPHPPHPPHPSHPPPPPPPPHSADSSSLSASPPLRIPSVRSLPALSPPAAPPALNAHFDGTKNPCANPYRHAEDNDPYVLADENRTLHRELASQDHALRELTRKTEALARHLVRTIRERAELQDRVVVLETTLRDARAEKPKKQNLEIDESAFVHASTIPWRAAITAKDRELRVCEDEIRRLRGIIERHVSRVSHAQIQCLRNKSNNGHSPLPDRDAECLVLELAASRVREHEAQVLAARVADELIAAQAHIQQLDARLAAVEREAAAQQIREIRACATARDSHTYMARSDVHQGLHFRHAGSEGREEEGWGKKNNNNYHHGNKNTNTNKGEKEEDASTWPPAARREIARLLAHTESLMTAHAESDQCAAQRYERVLHLASAQRTRCEELTAELKDMAQRISEAERWRRQLRDVREDAEMIAELLRPLRDGAESALRALRRTPSSHNVLGPHTPRDGEDPIGAYGKDEICEGHAVVEAFLCVLGRDWDAVERFLAALCVIDVGDDHHHVHNNNHHNDESSHVPRTELAAQISEARRGMRTSNAAAQAGAHTNASASTTAATTTAALSEAARARRDFVLYAVNRTLSGTHRLDDNDNNDDDDNNSNNNSNNNNDITLPPPLPLSPSCREENQKDSVLAAPLLPAWQRSIWPPPSAESAYIDDNNNNGDGGDDNDNASGGGPSRAEGHSVAQAFRVGPLGSSLLAKIQLAHVRPSIPSIPSITSVASTQCCDSAPLEDRNTAQEEPVALEEVEEEEVEEEVVEVVSRPRNIYRYHQEQQQRKREEQMASLVTGESSRHSRRTNESPQIQARDERVQKSQLGTLSNSETHSRIETRDHSVSQLYNAQELGTRPPPPPQRQPDTQSNAQSYADTNKNTDSRSHLVVEPPSITIESADTSDRENEFPTGSNPVLAPLSSTENKFTSLSEEEGAMRPLGTYSVSPSTTDTGRHSPTHATATSGGDSLQKPKQKPKPKVSSAALGVSRFTVHACQSANPRQMVRVESVPSNKSSPSTSPRSLRDVPDTVSVSRMSPEDARGESPKSSNEVSPYKAARLCRTITAATTTSAPSTFVSPIKSARQSSVTSHKSTSLKDQKVSPVKKSVPVSTPPAAKPKKSPAANPRKSPGANESHSEPRLRTSKPTCGNDSPPPARRIVPADTQSLSPLDAWRKKRASQQKDPAPVVEEAQSHTSLPPSLGHSATSAPSLTEPVMAAATNALSGAKTSAPPRRRGPSAVEMDLPSLYRPGMLNRPGNKNKNSPGGSNEKKGE